MKIAVLLSEAIGKTISAVAFSAGCGQCVLAFADGTFAVLGVESRRYAEDRAIVEDELDVFGFGGEALERAGIVAPGELDTMRKKRDEQIKAANEAMQEARDRQEFERLSRKFGAVSQA